MGDGVGENPNVVEGEALLVALMIFPQQRGFGAIPQAANTIAANPPDVDRIASVITQLPLGDRPVEIPGQVLVRGISRFRHNEPLRAPVLWILSAFSRGVYHQPRRGSMVFRAVYLEMPALLHRPPAVGYS